MAQFIFDKRQLFANIDTLQAAFATTGRKLSIFYSVKTNNSPLVLRAVSERCYFEIISSAEWQLISRYQPTRVVLNGPAKSAGLVRRILSAGVEELYFNIDNDTDLAMWQRLPDTIRARLRLGLRIYLDKPGVWNRFGYALGSVRTAELIRQLASDLRGLHFHFSTNNFRLDNYAAMLQGVASLCTQHKLRLDFLDIGGGLPGASDELHQSVMYKKLPELIAKYAPAGTEILSEVGRNLVENTCTLNARVVSIKRQSDEYYEIAVDTNIMHAPCIWEKKCSFSYLPKSKRRPRACQATFFGNSCMQIDVLAERLPLDVEPKVGDILVVRNAGAYSLSQAAPFIARVPRLVELPV